MPPRYVVERRPVAEVEADLRRLWDDNLTVAGGVARKFAWLYREAPDLRAGVLADLAVDRPHRSVGPALALAREAKAWTLGNLDLAYGFPNKLAEGVFKRVGYKVLGTMPRYARVLRHAGYAARVTEED